MYEVELSGNRKMLVLKDDIGISEELKNMGHHEPLATRKIVELIKPGMKIIDVGANIGYYAFIEAELVGETGKVYALEPVPKNIKCLEANVAKYNYRNIELFEYAAGSHNGFTTMRLAKFSNSGTLIKPGYDSEEYENWFGDWYTNDIRVYVTKLDDLRKKFTIPVPDMIRMDVEGYEIAVIFGAFDTLREMKPGSILFIEIHPKVWKYKEESVIGFIKWLDDFGFVPIWADDEDFGDNFVKWLCEIDYCPHVFFEKKANKESE